jgi:hypothetical protein
VNYLDPTRRGLEAGDFVTINDPNEILRDTTASTPGDYVRVITSRAPDVPEPATVVLLVFGLAGMAALRSRRELSKS